MTDAQLDQIIDTSWREWLRTYQQSRLDGTAGMVFFAAQTAFHAGYGAALAAIGAKTHPEVSS